MNKIQCLSLAGVLACVLCGPCLWAASTNAAAPAANAGAASAKPKAAPDKPRTAADGQFEQLVDDFVFGTLALSPTNATAAGYHVHHGASLDDLLDDFSPAGIAAWGGFLD